MTDMFPLTATYYDTKEKLWSGPQRKDFYSEKMTLGEVAFLELSKNPKKVIQINDATGEQLTAEEFLDNVTALAKNLVKLGLKAGDVVGLYAQNSTHIATVIMASYLCGTPVNALYSGFDKDNVQLIYKVTTPKIIFCDVENYKITKQVSEDLNLKAFVCIMNGFVKGVPNILDLVNAKAGIRNEPFDFPCVNLKGDDTAVILCSSGTTGTPKGVLCSHRALLNQPVYITAKSDSVMCSFSPMYWGSGNWNLNASLIKCCLRIITDKPYSTDYFLQLVERYKITHTITGSRQLTELSMYENIAKIRKCLASIDTLGVGGSKVPLVVQEKLMDMLKVNDKCIGFCVAYGMSELSGILTFNGERKVDCEGLLTCNKKVRIINKNGDFLGPNEHGEIIISTPYPWLGYYRNEEATRKAVINDWLYTGDIGFFDDEGFLHICGRDSDIFKSNNFQIYPLLIEDVVMELDGVSEACVVGVPDLMATNLISCAVVKRRNDNGEKLTANDVILYVESKMAKIYHLSGGVYFVDAMPKTSSGKVQRGKVLHLVQQENGNKNL